MKCLRSFLFVDVDSILMETWNKERLWRDSRAGVEGFDGREVMPREVDGTNAGVKYSLNKFLVSTVFSFTFDDVTHDLAHDHFLLI